MKGFIAGFAFGLMVAPSCLLTPLRTWVTAPIGECDCATEHSVQKFLGPKEPEGTASVQVSTEMKSLQVDVYGLPAEFLDSTLQVNALLESAISEMSKIMVLQKMTYHFEPSGLTSLWLLSASHASVHTWPAEGYAAIDFLTCGSSDLAHIAEVLQQQFEKMSPNVTFQFTLAERGQGTTRPPVNDLAVQLASMQQQKVAVYRGRSQFQSIEVWDVEGNSWVDGAHEVTARRLYLDGVLQLSLDDEAVYHETLVHPAMLAHKWPENVVIMGGGDGAALNRVLQHRSVKSAHLVEIDAQVIDVSKQAYPHFHRAWHDPRAEVVVADAFHWISDRARQFPSGTDAVFFDLLDVNVVSPLVDAIFAKSTLGGFITDIHKVLRRDGFAVFQLGERRIERPACLSLGGTDADCIGVRRQHTFVEELRSRFKTVFVFSQLVPSFLGEWLFAVASDDGRLLERWTRPADTVDADVAGRLFEHQSLRFFNGNVSQRLRPEGSVAPPIVIPHFQPGPAATPVADCPGLLPARENDREHVGYEVPYMLANSQYGNGIGVYTLKPIRRGEVIWRFHDENFRELTPENWREHVESHPYAKEAGVKEFLRKSWVNEYILPRENGLRTETKMYMHLDDARFTNHGYTTKRTDHFMQMADEGASGATSEDYKFGRAIIATRDIEACEELLEDYTTGSRDLGRDSEQNTPTWWREVLASYGLSEENDFVPVESGLPEWAWHGNPANTD